LRDADRIDRDFHALDDEGAPPPRVRKPAARAKARKPSLMRRLVIAPSLSGLAAVFTLSVRRPLTALGALCAFSVALGVIANALYLQQGAHPAPLFAGPQQPPRAPTGPVSSSIVAATAPVALPPISTQRAPAHTERLPLDPTPMSIAPARSAAAPAPQVAPQAAPAPQIAPQAAAAPSRAPSPASPLAPSSASSPAPAAKQPVDPIGALIRRDAPVVVNASAQQPIVVGATDPLQSRRIVAVQRALDRLGFQVASDGVLGSGTRAAIQRFERERDLPVTGDLSPRTLRALAARSGVAIP